MHVVFRTIDFASVFQVSSLVEWIVIGLIAGFLANVFVQGRSAGCLGNIIVGLLGSFIGGTLVSALDLGNFHFCGSIFVSFIGAAILLTLLRLIIRNSR
jgi:uncharacterized membrane protein YeaQ/YmgE (transglycosylase-associated protein family)